MVKFAFAGVVVSPNENSRASKDEARDSKANDLARGSEPVSKLYPIFIGAPVAKTVFCGDLPGGRGADGNLVRLVGYHIVRGSGKAPAGSRSTR